MSGNSSISGATEPAGNGNQLNNEVSLHELEVQACLCMNRILYLTQNPEIKSFFVSYVAGFSDFDPAYKMLLQDFITAIAPKVGLQVNSASKSPTATTPPEPLVWGYGGEDNNPPAPEQQNSENDNAVSSSSPALNV